MPLSILIAEDDPGIRLAVNDYLEASGYSAIAAEDGNEALLMLEKYHPHLLISDIKMPGKDGYELVKNIRQFPEFRLLPVIFLTECKNTQERIKGYQVGCDVYLPKPFELEELSARIRALLRRGTSSLPPVLTWEHLKLDPSSCEVFYQDNLLPLSPKEYKLLEFFLRNGRRVFSRAQILEHLWSFEQVPEEATVKAHIRGLRQKLEAAGAPHDLIETVYGLGYRLKEEPQQD